MEAAAAPEVSIKPMLGTTVGLRQCFAVRIDAAFDQAFKGEIKIFQAGYSAPIYNRRLNIGAGTFRWELNPQLRASKADSGELEIVFVDHRGRVMAKELFYVQGRAPEAQYRYGGISESAVVGILNSMPVLKGVLSRYAEADLVHLNAKLLPEDWRIMNNLDALILTGPGAASLSDVQIDMLTKWMSQGGVIMVDGSLSPETVGGTLGRQWGIATPSDPSEEQRTVTIPPLFGSPQYYQQQEEVKPETITATIKMRSLSRGGYTAGKTELESARHTPFGLGTLILHPVDLTALAGKSKDATGLMMIKGLNKSSKVDEYQNSGEYYYYSRNRSGWGSFMQTFCRLSPIAVGSVVIFVMLFVAIVGPIEYVLLRIFKKRHWTWLVTPCLVAIFCFGADAMSVLTRGTKPYRGTVSIADYTIDAGGKDTIYECVISPRAKRLGLSLPKDGQCQFYYGMGGSRRAPNRLSESKYQLPLRAWISSNYSVNVPHTRSAPYSVTIKQGRKRLDIRCQLNDGAPSIRKALLVMDGGRVYPLEKDEASKSWIYQGRVNAVDSIEYGDDLNSMLSALYGYHVTHDGEIQDAPEQLDNFLRWKSTLGGFSLGGRSALVPLQLAMPLVNDQQALLIVYCDETGLQSDIQWSENSHVESTSLVRQVISLKDGDES